jgi:hypothetical protein
VPKLHILAGRSAAAGGGLGVGFAQTGPPAGGSAGGSGGRERLAAWEQDNELRRHLVALAERAGLREGSRVDWDGLCVRCGLKRKGLDAARQGTDVTLRTLRGILGLARELGYDRLRILRAVRLLEDADLPAARPDDAAALLERAAPRDALSRTRQYLFDLAEALGPDEDALIAFAETFARRRGVWPPPDEPTGAGR